MFVAEQRSLVGQDVEVRIDSQFVAVSRNLQRALGGSDGGILLLNFDGKQSQCRQVIFHLLKRSQHGFAIIRDGRIILRAKLQNGRMSQSAIVNRFR